MLKGPSGFGFAVDDHYPQGQFIGEIISPSLHKGLRTHDLIVEINGQNVLKAGHGEVVSILRNIAQGESVLLLIERGMCEKCLCVFLRMPHYACVCSGVIHVFLAVLSLKRIYFPLRTRSPLTGHDASVRFPLICLSTY